MKTNKILFVDAASQAMFDSGNVSFLVNELPKQDIEVDVVTFDAVRKWPIGIRHIIFFFMLFRKAPSATHIYAQDPVSVGLPVWIVAKILKKRFWVKVGGDFAWERGVQKYGVQDMLNEFSQKTEGYVWQVMFLKSIQTFVVRRAEFVIVPSRYMRSIIVNWGIDSGKVYVIYEGFSGVASSLKDKEHAREVLGLSGTIMLSAGDLVPWKGFETLIRLIPNFIPQFPDIHLYIAGEGPQKEQLEFYIDQFGVTDHVTLLGSISKSSLHKYMLASDVFVLNTAHEGLSHVLLETLSIGLPTVTTDVGGNSEIVADGVSGKLVPYNDIRKLSEALRHILSMGYFRTIYSKEGKKVAEKFSREKMLNNFVDFLRKHEGN